MNSLRGEVTIPPPMSVYRRGAERPSDASYAGRVQPHRGLRAAARWANHQPVLLGLAHGREEEPAVSGTQQHRPLHRPLAHQPGLHDLQRRLQGPLLVPPHHHRLRHIQAATFLLTSSPTSENQIGCWTLRDLSELTTLFWSLVSILISFESAVELAGQDLKGNFGIFQPGPYFPMFLCV